MRFTRLRDTCRSENQVTRFASDSLIFFRPARCSIGSPPEAQGTNAEAFEARFLTAFGMTKVGIQIIIHSGFQPSAEGVALFPNASLRCTLD
ncbi:hypothetical protein [Tannerella forsythia]|uniref:hypothetical protein n=1 Tax=Tannerella forsythia TaxID=28112 RepID=UPI0028E99C54|nr:hypothetical protein [Tannerella forsythia]